MRRARLHVLDLGTMKMDRSLMVAKSTLASVDDPRREAEFVEFPVSAYLVEEGETRTLIDTGCNPHAMGTSGRWPPDFQRTFPYFGNEECQLPNRLKQLGYGPDDISHVVLSHMHNDHAGCVEYFGRSKIFVHHDEFSAALQSYALHEESSPFIWKDIDTWIKKKLDWYLVGGDEGDIPLSPRMTILNLGAGHSYGMLGLQLMLPETGGVILTSDAVYCSENFGPTLKPPGVIYDSLGWDRTARRLKKLAMMTESQVWFGHDAEQFAGLKKSTDGFYE